MTEQPKFQRRKRRGAQASLDAQKAQIDAAPDQSEAEIEALLSKKEALLKRKAQLEAERARAAELEAEQVRQVDLEAERARDAATEAQRLRQTEPQTAPSAGSVRAIRAPLSERPKPKSPLVLASAPKARPVHDSEAVWSALDRFPIDVKRLAKQNVITALRQDPSHTRFDILRTRMLQALAENGWKRVAITSPTKDCGKTFTSANLAISLSRQENCRTVLLDLDMRNPSLHKIFGVTDTGSIGDMLRGGISPARHLQGFAENSISAGSHVAIGFNGIVEPYAAELLQDPSTEQVFQEIERKFDPDVMLFDLPPALLNDDVIAIRPHIDALLIVAGGGMTKASDIKETEHRLGKNIPLLGVVLNKAEIQENGDYAY
ncbi:P-loop NTPase [Marivita sp.]|uniref:CpsD/CapB family tyrosine-protein kinase n=1 Tax=Marivita sp. TaxID=2003365 RepID=UPI0025BDD4C1|nr:P-loop NTPase [Marivita sp.]